MKQGREDLVNDLDLTPIYRRCIVHQTIDVHERIIEESFASLIPIG